MDEARLLVGIDEELSTDEMSVVEVLELSVGEADASEGSIVEPCSFAGQLT
jgi:hypothetical protein